MLTELNDDGNDDSTCFNQIVFVHFYKKKLSGCAVQKRKKKCSILVLKEQSERVFFLKERQ